ncbi:hypothetical protein POM88_036690 [Heracleum sosnowskyi]|uniref:Uncharacterized protein n=1 Tax=Heracleum sosnowskyi TaxID=360622 RepID=A0AAD8HPP7_9APIA|nr:hypothetical protein POM88_036690 [Heracleum sosnowskyi]
MYGNEAAQQEAAQQTAVEIEVVEDEEVISVESDKQEEKCDKKGKRSSKAWSYFDELKGCAKTLKFEKLSKDDKFQTLQPHTFDQEKLRKKLALMCTKDNQPFRIVEHEGFRELMNEAEPKLKMPSGWTVARDCLKIYSDDLSKLKKNDWNKVYIIAFGVNAPAD